MNKVLWEREELVRGPWSRRGLRYCSELREAGLQSQGGPGTSALVEVKGLASGRGGTI